MAKPMKPIKLANRRGMTLILIAFMMTIMIGLSAFVVDFGRMYLFRSQLHSAADGAALAGVFRMSQTHTTDAQDTAVSYGTRASVANAAVGLAAADVQSGKWNGTTFTSASTLGVTPWTNGTLNAVQVTTRYTGSFIFGRFFGMTNRALSATAVAVNGSVGAATCARPWASPYQLLLNQLAAVYGGPVQDATTYVLTDTDIAHLAALTAANNTTLKVGSQNGTWTPTSGNFYGVKLPPIVYANGTVGNPWNGGNDYRDGIGDTCAQVTAAFTAQGESPYVSVGDWLQPENGNMIGPTKQGLQTLCGLSGSNYTCSPAVRVTVAMWDTFGAAPGNPSGCGGKCFHVKYMGVFYVTGYDTVNDAITGYFSTMNNAGPFSPSPGPIEMRALVK
jgi:Flp pilus assembly protein TadG